MKFRNFHWLPCSVVMYVAFLGMLLLVLLVDVNTHDLTNTTIGLFAINQYWYKLIEWNEFWYTITDWLGLVPVLVGLCFGLIGAVQLVSTRSVKNVQYPIKMLGVFYVFVILIYILFEVWIVNYRPVLIEGFKEASFPSTHIFVSIFVLLSAVDVMKEIQDDKYSTRFISMILYSTLFVIVVGRVLSGAHWFTDIVSGLFLSFAVYAQFKHKLLVQKSSKKLT